MFLLTLAVVDDVCALLVIAIAYSSRVSFAALAAAAGFLLLLLALRYAQAWRKPTSIAVAVGLWVSLFKSGIDPVIAGLAIGLATSAYPPSREDLERATSLARSFREQPTPELAREAQIGVSSAISANERLQYALHPWTSFVIVPLFALANAGVHVTAGLLEDALSSPITLGIFFGYLLGKPIGITAASWIASRPRLHGPRPPVSGPVLAVGGAVAGIGFTVSLLISSLAFSGRRLDEAKLGALATVLAAPLLGWALVQIRKRLPDATVARQVASTAEDLLDLSEDVAARARPHPRPP